MSKELDRLTKSDTGTAPPPGLSEFEYSRRKVIGICRSLSKASDAYLPSKTISSIKDYIGAGDRIIYSELTNFVYELSSVDSGIVATNLESLLTYAMNPTNSVEDDVKKIVVRLWDHFHLAIHQVENTRTMLATRAEEVTTTIHDELYQEFKGMEKEYIAILGIFASIVLTFTAGITFSTSVLQNLHTVNIYQSGMAILLIGLVLTNVLYGLFYYINHLIYKNDKSSKPIKALGFANAILIILLVLVSAGWYFGIAEQRDSRIEDMVAPKEVVATTNTATQDITSEFELPEADIVVSDTKKTE